MVQKGILQHLLAEESHHELDALVGSFLVMILRALNCVE